MKSKFHWLFSLLCFSVIAQGAFAEDEPLAPDEAFSLHAYAVDADTVRAEWTIADGYYLYREKFRFTTTAPGVTLGEPISPPGKVKEDEFFGKVESYRHKVAIDIPVTRAAGAPDTFVLETKSQGCADLGICYPPHSQRAELVLPPRSAASPASPPDASPLAKLASFGKQLFGSQDNEFLEPDEAFAPRFEVVDGNTVVVRWDIADGYYMYRDRFDFTLTQADGVQLGAPVFPRGKEKVDEAFGRMEVYYHEAVATIPLSRSNLAATDIMLEAKYQGCAEKGFCYPPMSRSEPLRLPTGQAEAPMASAASVTTDGGFISEQDGIARRLASDNVWLTIVSFFGFGLLLAFTPCVFPMVPILSSIIVGQGEGLSTRRAFTLSLAYVLAMATTYTVAGVFAGIFGQNLQAAFQNPWILSVFATIFVVLALSMFGFYELQLPARWQGRLTEISNRQRGGTVIGVAVMGFLSALIVGPCVAAPLAGALIYIGQTGDAALGGIALFALSLGMGAPLLALGTSAGKLLPRAGAWMEAVKAVFGVALLAVAIWMLERIVPVEAAMTMWAALLIVSAVYLGALERLAPDAGGWCKLRKGGGVLMLVYGALLLVGVAGGGTDTLQPLRGVSFAGAGGAASAPAQEVHFKRVKGLDQLNREVAAAAQAGKPVLLDFYADWCVSCKEMEKYTFSAPEVQAVLSKGVLLQADVTANDAVDRELLKRFRLIGPPSMLFFDTAGNEQRAYRLVGFLEPEDFRQHAQKAFSL